MSAFDTIAEAIWHGQIEPGSYAAAVSEAIDAIPDRPSRVVVEELTTPNEPDFCSRCGYLWAAHGVMTQCTAKPKTREV